MATFDSGSTGFIIVCMALVNLMTPGLAFFYGGLVRQQNVLTIIMQNFVSMGLVTMIWIVWGFSLCFGESGKLIGNPSTYAMLSNIEDHAMHGKRDVNGALQSGGIPGLAFAGASLTPASTHLQSHTNFPCDRNLLESLTSSSVARSRARHPRF